MTDAPQPSSTEVYDPFFEGQQLGGQFQVARVLGHNEVGTVYLATKLDDNREMTLKALPMALLGEEGYQALREEIKAVSGVRNKHLARTFGLGREGEAAFVIMEHLTGQSLADYLHRRRERGEALNPKGVYNLVGHLSSALKSLHDGGVTHGALTPRHVFVTDKGRIKVINPGYAAFVANLLAPRDQGAWMDSPFIAPEVREAPGSLAPSSDVYALGLLVGELLSLAPLSHDPAQARAEAVAVAEALHPQVREAIARATDDDPDARPRDVNEVRDLLKILVDATAIAEAEHEEPEPEEAAPAQATPEPQPEAAAPQDAAPRDAAPEVAAPEAPEAPDEPDLEPEAAAPPSMDDDPFARAAKLLGRTGAHQAIGAAAAAPDEATRGQARYLVSKAGLDYGPFTYDQVLEQLHADEIDEFTPVLDRAQQIRQPLREMPVFAKAVIDYLPVREERRRLEAERRAQMVETAKTVGKRTSYAGIVAALALGAVVAVYWFFIRPSPAELPESIFLADLGESYKMLPPPKEFNQINVDKDALAALFNENQEQPGKRGGRGGRWRGGKRPGGGAGGGGGGGGEGDEDLTNSVDFENEGGGSTHILTDQEVTRVVLGNWGGLQSCLIPEMKRNPSFKGVHVKFFIKPSGTTAGVKLVEGQYDGGPVGACLKSRFRVMKFPAHGGFNKGVIFPLVIKR